MNNSRIGLIVGVCVLLVVTVAVVWSLQPKDSDKPESIASGQVTNTSRSDIGLAAHAVRDETSAASEDVESWASSEDPLGTGGFGSHATVEDRPVMTTRMPEDHPLARNLGGWIQEPERNELGSLDEPGTGIARGVFVDTPEDTRSRGDRIKKFDPSNPDDILDLGITGFDFAGRSDSSLRFTAVVVRQRDRASWRVVATGDNTAYFLLPVRDGDTFQIQLRSGDGRIALGYLPVPGTLHIGYPTRDLYRRGMVSFRLRLVAPDQQPRARSIQVTDAAGNPVKDAVILQGGQEFGRSNAAGVIEWPFPPPTPSSTGKIMLHERGFMLSAPGYVPVVLPRGEVADPQQPTLHVKLNTREFVASVWGGVIDERFMHLAPNISSSENWHNNHSEILSLGWDLLPLEPDAQVAGWEDAFYYLAFSELGRERWAKIREKWGSDRGPGTSGHLGPFGRGRRKPSARPFTKSESGSLTSSWADGLEAAVGRPYHELWPDFYGGWYNGRWKYESGQFDVVLPYPGKFLLLVGEEYREGMNGSKPGQVNHVLYIDALDPANVKGELFRCPD